MVKILIGADIRSEVAQELIECVSFAPKVLRLLRNGHHANKQSKRCKKPEKKHCNNR